MLHQFKPGDPLLSVLTGNEFLELSTVARLARHSVFVFAMYNTPASRQQLIDELARRVAPIPLFTHALSPQQPNPREYLQNLPAGQQKERAVINFLDIETAWPEAPRWFDLQRDALAANPHVLVLWIKKSLRPQFAKIAPNFFSRHSGVFDLRLLPAPASDSQAGSTTRSEEGMPSTAFETVQDWERIHALYDKLLAEYENDPGTPPETLVQIRLRLFSLEMARAQFPAAQQHIRAAQALFERGMSEQTRADLIHNAGRVSFQLSQLPEARARYEEALPIYRAIGAKLGEANTLSVLVRLDFGESKNIPRAEREISAVIKIRQKIGDSYGEAADCGNFGIALLNLGEKSLAKKYLLRARAIFARIGVETVAKMIDGLLERCEQ
mgnify:CR=1 FL=1